MPSLRWKRGTQKPPLGAIYNPEHPFMRGHLLSAPFNGAGTFPLWRDVGWSVGLGDNFGGPAGYFGGAVRPREFTLSESFADHRYTTNTEGLALQCDTLFSNVNLGESSFLPTDGATVLVIVRIINNVAFQGGRLLQLDGPPADNQAFHIYAPFNGDNNTYWRFGGVSGSNSLNGDIGIGDGISDVPHRFIFNAGPRGMAVWHNGVKVLSSSTAVTRNASTADLLINGIAGFGYSAAQYNYFHIADYQWSDALCQWWSAEPYDHMYPSPVRKSYFTLGSVDVPVEASLSGVTAISGGGLTGALMTVPMLGSAPVGESGEIAAYAAAPLSGKNIPVIPGSLNQTADAVITSMGQYHAGRRRRYLWLQQP